VQDKLGSEFKVYREPDLTFAGGLITCAHCGRVVTGELKCKTSPNGIKRQYTYYRCSGYTANGHPKDRLTEQEVDRQLLDLFAAIRIDEEAHQWFVEVIRARAHSGQAESKLRRDEIKRQYDQVTGKLATLLDLRVEGEIDQAEYTAKRAELHDRQAGLHVQLEASDRDDDEIADLERFHPFRSVYPQCPK
jgi:hypothetical protein